jgi:hypothetical protein
MNTVYDITVKETISTNLAETQHLDRNNPDI